MPDIHHAWDGDRVSDTEKFIPDFPAKETKTKTKIKIKETDGSDLRCILFAASPGSTLDDLSTKTTKRCTVHHIVSKV
jgi:hypothetical protein